MDEAYRAWRDALASGEGLAAAEEKLYRLLARYARAIVFNTLDRQDPALTQDIVSKAFLKAKTYHGTANFGTWFWRLAYNECLMDLRTRRRRKELFLEDLVEEPVQPFKEPSVIADVLDRIRPLLKPDEAQLVDLRLEGYSLAEIAAQRGWDRKRLDREWNAAKAHIKKLLEPK